jgi:hypothetical protein
MGSPVAQPRRLAAGSLPPGHLHGRPPRGADGPSCGPDAPNLSPSVIARLIEAWQEEYDCWRRRDLSFRRYVYIWARGKSPIGGVGLRFKERSRLSPRGRARAVSSYGNRPAITVSPTPKPQPWPSLAIGRRPPPQRRLRHAENKAPPSIPRWRQKKSLVKRWGVPPAHGAVCPVVWEGRRREESPIQIDTYLSNWSNWRICSLESGICNMLYALLRKRQ